MKKTILMMLILSLNTIYSQVVDSTLNKWRPSFIASANLSQIAFDNWTKGGENSLAYSFGLDWAMKYKTSDWKFKNQLKGEWGQSKLVQRMPKLHQTIFLTKQSSLLELVG